MGSKSEVVGRAAPQRSKLSKAIVVILSSVLFLLTAYNASFLRISVSYDPDRWKQWPAGAPTVDGAMGRAEDAAAEPAAAASPAAAIDERAEGAPEADPPAERLRSAPAPVPAAAPDDAREAGAPAGLARMEPAPGAGGAGRAGALPRRKLLLFNHLPKAGGKYVVEVLSRLVPASSYVVRNEFDRSTAADRRTHFVIGNIREVCSYYLSLFHYGVQQGGNMKNQFIRRAMPTNPQLRRVYDDANDVGNFHLWLDVIKGTWSRRIRRSHPDLAVDCWVRTTALDEDLASCLRQFRQQGGRLRPEASEFLDRFVSDRGDGKTLIEKRVHPSTYEHSCEHFYNATQREEVKVYDKMACDILEGGCDCCGSLPEKPVREDARWTTRFDAEVGMRRDPELYWNLPNGPAFVETTKTAARESWQKRIARSKQG